MPRPDSVICRRGVTNPPSEGSGKDGVSPGPGERTWPVLQMPCLPPKAARDPSLIHRAGPTLALGQPGPGQREAGMDRLSSRGRGAGRAPGAGVTGVALSRRRGGAVG